MLQSLAPDLWEVDAPLSVMGMALGHRMTVARLRDGSLWLHSPVAHSPEIVAALAPFGSIRHLVAPNCIHDTYLEGWFAACPTARFHGAPHFARFRPDLKFTDTLSNTPDPAWAATFDQHVIRGMPRLNEVAFLHRPSRTLVVTDLVFNLGPEMPFLSRVLLRLNDCDCKFAVSRLLKTTIKDRAAVRKSIDHLLAWDFDRIVMSHGRNVETDGREMLREAFQFL
jgi:hypothetical protein